MQILAILSKYVLLILVIVYDLFVFKFKGVNSALTTYFFGENLDEKLTIEKFLGFQQQLQTEILGLEVSKQVIYLICTLLNFKTKIVSAKRTQ